MDNANDGEAEKSETLNPENTKEKFEEQHVDDDDASDQTKTNPLQDPTK